MHTSWSIIYSNRCITLSKFCSLKRKLHLLQDHKILKYYTAPFRNKRWGQKIFIFISIHKAKWLYTTNWIMLMQLKFQVLCFWPKSEIKYDRLTDLCTKCKAKKKKTIFYLKWIVTSTKPSSSAPYQLIACDGHHK